MAKIKLGIMYGGKSAEHEVSLISAKNVAEALDKSKYKITKIFIDKSGKFDINQLSGLDVVFPILHGPNGEDGTIQGLLKILNIPFVGPGVLGSAICMDKDVTKKLLLQAGLPTAKYVVYHKNLKPPFPYPFFVKPANLGSSVGISKVTSKSEFLPAIKLALQHDSKVIVEESISGREIECSVLDDKASVPGEVIPHDDFYTYKAKYLDPEGAELLIPAPLSPALTKRVQGLAVKAFQVLCCEGMARVDFFLKGQDLYINELNTIPGFTNISMYPKLWEASGLPYSQLLDRLIQLAMLK